NAALAQEPSRDISKLNARASREWVRDGVIYEIYPRDFSQEGNLNGITAQLDRLQELGVTILWLMPIHPIGQEKKKGTIGSPYAVREYMTDMLKYWIREYDLDGFRCDVAEDVPTEFWDHARAELDKIKPDMFMLAEGHKPDLEV